MTDPRMPNFWWCPTHHLYRGGDRRPCVDAVQLVPAPPAPQVFLPGDVLPRNMAVLNTAGVLYGPAPGWTVSIPGVAIPLPSAAQVEALVERAWNEREEAA